MMNSMRFIQKLLMAVLPVGMSAPPRLNSGERRLAACAPQFFRHTQDDSMKFRDNFQLSTNDPVL